jgi:hypothetical protein
METAAHGPSLHTYALMLYIYPVTTIQLEKALSGIFWYGK